LPLNRRAAPVELAAQLQAVGATLLVCDEANAAPAAAIAVGAGLPLARVEALISEAAAGAGGPMTAGLLSLDLEGLSLRIGEAAPLRLTKLEARLLQILIANAGHVVGTERLLVHVWGSRGSGDRQLLKQLVHRLRHKIEQDPAQPRYLQTDAGAGYRLAVDAPDQR